MSEGFWWAALAIAGASAAAHLVSMLGTHWGDHRVSAKALLFSLMAHLSLVFCLFAVGPKLERLGRAAEPAPEPEPLTVREVVSDADEPIAADEDGNVPVWDRPNETPATPQERIDRPFDVPEMAETDRAIEPPPSPIDRPVPAIQDLPEMAEAAPDQQVPAAEELAAEPPKPLEIDAETAEAREEDRPPIARTDRTPAAEAGEDLPPETERAALPAATERVADDFDPRKQIAGLRPENVPAELPALDSADDAPKIERPSSPLPAPPAEVVGAGDDSEGAQGDAALSSRFSRRPTRSRDFGGTLPSIDRGESDVEAPAIPRRDIAMSNVDRLNSPTADTLPSISRPDAAPLNQRRTSVPETYQLRAIERRSEIAQERRHRGFRTGGRAKS